ncbi:nucleoside-diphosphate kinase [Thiospirochaeta perfilievii]|uniref:Nucleoside diphosphate kinase n=1 Tax=Thiospirochaeta perfilievii TaxID=252967 RepID=A0A5C1QER3_9SPIO|nr:nucleoside-diphosphate kinase [Thiospirochaeta perfilievii]QEN06061.1 nucleoside-diphosphate kinase [Thiospirochaeta perfilievii]
MERTFAMLKPGVLQRRIVGEIISRLEKKGFQIVGLKMIQLTKGLAQEHYKEHLDKDFYPGMEKYITSGPVVLLVLKGINSVQILRSIVGPTFSPEAPSGTIRGDYGFSMRNIIHASDSVESAEREISIYFKDEEIIEYNDNNREWID